MSGGGGQRTCDYYFCDVNVYQDQLQREEDKQRRIRGCKISSSQPSIEMLMENSALTFLAPNFKIFRFYGKYQPTKNYNTKNL